MALNTYLTLTLDGVAVNGSVTQTGRVNMIEVHSLEWSFDSDGNIGEVKFVGDIDKATPVIAAGLKGNQVADATFQFWTPQLVGGTGSGTEAQYFTLHGTAGRVTSLDMWMANNKDPSLAKYQNAVQYTMKFTSMQILWVDGAITTTIP